MEGEDPFAIFEQPIKRNRPEGLEEEGPRKIYHKDPLHPQ